MKRPERPRVLVVDDHASMAEMVSDGLNERGFAAEAIPSSASAAKRLAEGECDALVTDLRMPEVDGLGLLAISRRLAPERPVIVMTAYSAVETAVESIRQGAYHYLTKPFKVDELVLFLSRALDEARLRRETAALRRTLKDRFAVTNVIARSGAMQEVCDLVARLANAEAPVLLLGETGTGKGLIARTLHAESDRASAPFVTVNCAAVPEHLLESELFGHVKGAFTGASSATPGLFEEADGGILFLDEIAELPGALQPKLLDVLERGVVRAVGASKERRVNVRILAATHRDLRARIATGAFREDLLYRLEVITIEIPPLRLRRDDIPVLIEHFFEQSRRKHPSSVVKHLAVDVSQRLLDHDWPGNVRELAHVIERLVLLGRAAEVEVGDLPPTVGKRRATQDFSGDVVPLREMSRRYAQWAFEALDGRKLETAEMLDVDVKTLTKLLRNDGESKP
jgi:two-component system response regulator HydG